MGSFVGIERILCSMKDFLYDLDRPVFDACLVTSPPHHGQCDAIWHCALEE